jgi:general stress protein CsbA
MTGLPAFAAAFPGIFVGLFAVGAFNHWLSLLLTAMGKAASGPASRGWATVFTLVHPLPWIVVVGGALGLKALSQSVVSAAWIWFWGAAILIFAGIYGMSLVLALKLRSRSLTKSVPNKT